MDDELLRRINELSNNYTKLGHKYCMLIDVIIDLNRCYPHILREVVTEEKLEEILGDE